LEYAADDQGNYRKIFGALRRKKRIGDRRDPAFVSARGFARAYHTSGGTCPAYFSEWIALEYEQGNVGRDDTSKEKYTANWLKEYILGGSVEKTQGTVSTIMKFEYLQFPGDFKVPEPLSARQIAREYAASNRELGEFWKVWAENESVIGSFEDPSLFSKRWIARTHYLENSEEISFLKFALAVESGVQDYSISPDAPFSTRWCANTLLANGNLTDSSLYSWLNFELSGVEHPDYESMELGEILSPKAKSIRGILRGFLADDKMMLEATQSLMLLLSIEEGENLGEVKNPKASTFRGLVKRYWKLGGRRSYIIAYWLMIEEKHENFGDEADENAEFSALWLAEYLVESGRIDDIEEQFSWFSTKLIVDE
jgi:hypothetical protein